MHGSRSNAVAKSIHNDEPDIPDHAHGLGILCNSFVRVLALMNQVPPF
jgi:hypothetical protein